MNKEYRSTRLGARAISPDSQAGRVIAILKAAYPGEVSALELQRQSRALQYSRAVFESKPALRDQGYVVKNRTEYVEGQRRGFFRLERITAPVITEPASKPVAPKRPAASASAPESLFSTPLRSWAGDE